jgi:hypothetical protein
MITNAMPVIDPLTIPVTMSTYCGVMKSIAVIIFGAFFVVAVLDNQIKMVGGGEGEMRKILRRAVVVLAGIVLYRHIFSKIVALNEIISMSLLDLGDFAKFKTLLVAHLDQQTVSFIKLDIATAVTALFLFIAVIAETLLQYFRYILLSILYVLGPLAIVCGMLPKAADLTKGWFTTLLQVSFWVIILRATQAVMLSIGLEQVLNNGEIMGYLFVSVLITVMVFYTPLISERLVSGANISLMGGIAMTAATVAMTKFASHPVTKAGAGVVKAAGLKGAAVAWTGTRGMLNSWSSNLFKPKAGGADTPADKPAPRR